MLSKCKFLAYRLDGSTDTAVNGSLLCPFSILNNYSIAAPPPLYCEGVECQKAMPWQNARHLLIR